MDASRYALHSWSAEPARFFVQYNLNLEQTRFRLTGTAGAGATAIAIDYFHFFFLPLSSDWDLAQNVPIKECGPSILCQPLAEPNGREREEEHARSDLSFLFAYSTQAVLAVHPTDAVEPFWRLCALRGHFTSTNSALQKLAARSIGVSFRMIKVWKCVFVISTRDR